MYGFIQALLGIGTGVVLAAAADTVKALCKKSANKGENR